MSVPDCSPLSLIVFDWAGTMVDFGCLAPVRAMVKVMAGEGVAVDEVMVRADMGMAKRDHLHRLLNHAEVQRRWQAAHGAPPDERDIDRIYAALQPMMIEAAKTTTALVPGATAMLRDVAAAGLRVASCTGYTRAMMAALEVAAAEQGYRPEMIVCAGETPQGRPSPLMLYRICAECGVWPMRHVVKVDDAPVGIAEGLAAGAWTVGVAASGNAVGLPAEALAILEPEETEMRIAAARQSLEAAGAHYVVNSVADLVPVLGHIAARLRAGAMP